MKKKDKGLNNLPEFKADAQVWDRIEKELDGKKDKKVVAWIWRGGIAACLGALLWVLVFQGVGTSSNGTFGAGEVAQIEPISTTENTSSIDTQKIDNHTYNEKEKFDNQLTDLSGVDAKQRGGTEEFNMDIVRSLSAQTSYNESSADGSLVENGHSQFKSEKKDTDNDGVPDEYDLQVNSICQEVDMNGVALDDDGDGIPNCEDAEVSRPGDQVDMRGQAINIPAQAPLPSQQSTNLFIEDGKSFFANAISQPSNRADVYLYYDVSKEKEAYKRLVEDVDGDGVGDFIDVEDALGRNDNRNYYSTDSVRIYGNGMPDYSTESYAELIENKFENPMKEPLSTFGIDVDNASYAIMRSKLNSNQFVPKNSVRIEEYVNYFSYPYKQPQFDQPFSITTEMASCPWNEKRNLVHIGLQGKSLNYNDIKPSNLVFLIDVSGSMDEENKLPLVKKSMKALVAKLGENDRVAIVTYAGAAGLALESTSCSKKDFINNKIDKLDAGGSTAGGEGIKLAYKVANENLLKNGNNRIILCTDGDFNVGQSSNGEMKTMAESNRDKGIFITACGFGMGNYQDDKMETIADYGNGNYFYIDTYREADKVFSRELTATLFTIAKDVKIQVEFNPEYVKAYRLIGYENRLMPAQDFANDAKDGGELGAGHTVTALYEIIPVGSTEEISSSESLRYQKPAEGVGVKNDEVLLVKLRYKQPTGSKSRLIEKPVMVSSKRYQEASSTFRYSAGVALFASTLRQSSFTDDKGFKLSESLITNNLGRDVHGDGNELLQLIKKAQTIYSVTVKE